MSSHNKYLLTPAVLVKCEQINSTVQYAVTTEDTVI